MQVFQIQKLSPQATKIIIVEETHPSYVLFKKRPLALAVINTFIKILKVLQEYSPEDVFIGFFSEDCLCNSFIFL